MVNVTNIGLFEPQVIGRTDQNDQRNSTLSRIADQPTTATRRGISDERQKQSYEDQRLSPGLFNRMKSAANATLTRLIGFYRNAVGRSGRRAWKCVDRSARSSPSFTGIIPIIFF
jgi:hypothetical protein